MTSGSAGSSTRSALIAVLVLLGVTAPLSGRPADKADPTPFPVPSSKKGLSVQMVEDAIRLGIRHATLNCTLDSLLTTAPAEGDFRVIEEEQEFHLRRAGVERLDAQIAPLSDAGVVVYLILLVRRSGDPGRDRLLVHPDFHADAPHYSAFNVVSDPGRAALGAVIGFLARRYSGDDPQQGRVWGWIVGNEVNSHWYWYNLGRATREQVVDQYEQAVRLVHRAVRRHSRHGRVYLSLEHHWVDRYAAGDPDQTLSGRWLLRRFAGLSRERGDFDWHVAFHPYPENLFECRFWNDRSALDRADTPRITFRNLHQLTRFLGTTELRLGDQPRRVILSEQGFHCGDEEGDEAMQAAAFAAAWQVVRGLDGVDAFILHRHVDHAHEGGLRLGLWSRQADTVCTPERQRAIYRAFLACDRVASQQELDFALPLLGLSRWDQLPEFLGRADASGGR